MMLSGTSDSFSMPASTARWSEDDTRLLKASCNSCEAAAYQHE